LDAPLGFRARDESHADGAGTPRADTARLAAGGLFETGRNCWTVARAQRVALIVDGEDYFRNFVLAAERATRSIGILSWEFNSTTRLRFDEASDGPARLGDFLNWLAKRRRALNIHVLDWDYPLVFGTDRELRTLFGFGWRPRRRVHRAYDNTQPLSASHHQKVVVIDDAMAFVGGFDLTVRRWDTCAHLACEDRRLCENRPYAPFHDMMMAVDGDCARALGVLFRERWRAATGRRLRPANGLAAPWPDSLTADLTEVDVALARTLPELPNRPAVAEVEVLYLDMIAAARERIYIENQYFTAYRIGDALEARLRETDGPEIVLVLRLFSHGWLEEHTMHVLRARLIERLRAADTHGRFHVYYPHIEGLAENLCIDLHSKLMIIDDEILRIGSSNLSNRSLGMDSECDAAIAARGDPRIAGVIRDFRNRLLAEHLDAERDAVDQAVRRLGRLDRAIAALGGRSRTLRQLENLPEWPQAVIELASVGDPQRPVSFDHLIDEFSPEQLITAKSADSPDGPRRGAVRRAVLKLGAVVLLLVALVAMWRYTPLAQWVEPVRVTGWARTFGDRAWAPLLIILAYTPACIVMFPRALITLAAVVAFGPWLGCAYALAGVLVAALATYFAGFALPRQTVYSLGGERLLHLADVLRRRSLLAMTALRLVPLAPFAVEGLAAAVIGVPLLPFLFGTLFGILPGTLATTVFGDQLETVLRDPSQVNYVIVVGAVLLVALASLAVRRWLVRQHHHRAAGSPNGHADQRPR
jgi:phosphatidylserine/phosphatidylglycerophosphate/cardiolipin synthase-like enzyme/uncharacterized membrane protein YdjX (TVP38/TMEM64 family)